MKSIAAALLVASAATSEMFSTRSPHYGHRSYPTYHANHHTPTHRPQASYSKPSSTLESQYAKYRPTRYDAPKFMSPTEALAVKVDRNQQAVDSRINHLEHELKARLNALEANSVRLLYDYFYVNDEEFEIGRGLND